MARNLNDITDPTPEDELAYVEWAAQTEPALREVAARFRPWVPYRVDGDGRDLDSPRKHGMKVFVKSFSFWPDDHSIDVVVRTAYAGIKDRDQRLFRIAPDCLLNW